MITTSFSCNPTRAALVGAVALVLACGAAVAKDFAVLQPLGDKPEKMKDGGYYVPSSLQTVRWGSLPNADAKPVLSVPSGSTVTFDSVSHEGILEDQGKNPTKYFGLFGIKPSQVL